MHHHASLGFQHLLAFPSADLAQLLDGLNAKCTALACQLLVAPLELNDAGFGLLQTPFCRHGTVPSLLQRLLFPTMGLPFLPPAPAILTGMLPVPLRLPNASPEPGHQKHECRRSDSGQHGHSQLQNGRRGDRHNAPHEQGKARSSKETPNAPATSKPEKAQDGARGTPPEGQHGHLRQEAT